MSEKREYLFILQGEMTAFQRAVIAKWRMRKAVPVIRISNRGIVLFGMAKVLYNDFFYHSLQESGIKIRSDAGFGWQFPFTLPLVLYASRYRIFRMGE